MLRILHYAACEKQRLTGLHLDLDKVIIMTIIWDNFYFIIFDEKHILWVLIGIASLWRFQ